MKAQKLASIIAALAFIGACATEPEKPAPTPAPVAKPAPVPQPQAVPAPPPPKPVAQAPKPEPKPEPPKKPAVTNLASTELFEFNKAVLTKEARAKLDSEVIAKLGDLRDVRYIIVNGHADRLGSPQYNQKLSEQRAEAVRAYLVSKGVDASKVETLGFGKTLPVKACPDQKQRKELIECLSPNRRVVVEVQGTPR
ncbi:MAG TPA: OmpA family protein [Burkholderiales bacterium]|nr:OmpA family protein [Burkholderiales bacterium]